MAEYREHEKLHKIQNQSQICGEFLEWLFRQGFHLGRWEGQWLEPANEPIQDLLAGFFNIDRETLEAEKMQMLRDIGQINELKDA
jgi:hypothetical protein